MKQLRLPSADELIIDNFAGGGGASTGIESAIGRPVDIAINHDPEAIAMHRVNHPHTKHYCESVWDINPREITGNQPVGLVWLSPDCKHFSKAKGGAPVEKRIRGLAWVALRWAATVRPRVIMLENVEEFVTWGPIGPDGKPCKRRKGKTFGSFVRALQRQGYAVEYRELRACDYGAPTIRKRLFLIARRDGLPIVWPAPTHGDPKSEAVKRGKLQPWRIAAMCIDFSIPCPSIFLSPEEARVIGVKRPLAETTMRRIAKGIMRYVINAANPFIVPLTHHGADRAYGVDAPVNTVTAAHRGELAIVQPFVVGAGGPIYSGKPKSAFEPFGTQTTENHRAVVAPIISTYYGDKRPDDVRGIPLDEPLRTQTTENRHALVTAFLAKNYTGVVGSDLAYPIGTVTGIDHHSLVVPVMTECANASSPRSWDAGEPLRTICAQTKGGHHALITAHIQRDFGSSVGHAAAEPLGTITAGAGGHSAVVSAYITKFRTGAIGSDCAEPLHTITAGGESKRPAGAAHAMGIVSANLIKLRGDNIGHSADEPLHTISAQGTHFAEVRAFLTKFYGNEKDGASVNEPLHTIRSKDRHALVTVYGQDYVIVDIGMRMLSPRELFRAQGFPDSYIIGDNVAQGLSLTKTAQVRMVGNSVCPPLAQVLVEANFKHEAKFMEKSA